MPECSHELSKVHLTHQEILTVSLEDLKFIFTAFILRANNKDRFPDIGGLKYGDNIWRKDAIEKLDVEAICKQICKAENPNSYISMAQKTKICSMIDQTLVIPFKTSIMAQFKVTNIKVTWDNISVKTRRPVCIGTSQDENGDDKTLYLDPRAGKVLTEHKIGIDKCYHDGKCRNIFCSYTHTQYPRPCKNGPKCSVVGCRHIHYFELDHCTIGDETVCKWDGKCMRKNCRFLHPKGQAFTHPTSKPNIAQIESDIAQLKLESA